MSFHTAESRALRGRSEGSDEIRLRFHDSPVSAIKPPRFAELGCKDPEMLGVWSGLIGEFLDRRASHRFNYYADNHACYLWKPKLALVVPEFFAAERLSHRSDMIVALEVLASVMDHYNLEVVSNSPDAARIFSKVTPYSHKAIAECNGALVILSRSLNEAVGAIRPSRFIAADPCAFRTNKKRIVFETSSLKLPFALANDGEITWDSRGVSVFLDEDDEVPSFLQLLRRLRSQDIPLRITLSSRTDMDFARRAHAVFNNDSQVRVNNSEPGGDHDQTEFQISNNLITLLTQRKSSLVRLLYRNGGLWRVGETLPAGRTTTFTAVRSPIRTVCSVPGSVKTSSKDQVPRRHT